jgi:menaquinone-dependent protoporphyrinogen oxidase
MAGKILVGYATKYGSTQEVANVIADVLREDGREVVLHDLKDVKSISEFQAVVIGAPFYMFKWLKPAHDFLNRFQKTLKTIPVAVFALGPTDALETAEKNPELFEQLEKTLREYTWLTPVDQKLFGGKFDPAKLKFPMRLFVGKMPASDIRNWEEIKTWTEGLKTKFA